MDALQIAQTLDEVSQAADDVAWPVVAVWGLRLLFQLLNRWMDRQERR